LGDHAKKVGGTNSSEIGAKFSSLGPLTLEPVGVTSRNLSLWCIMMQGWKFGTNFLGPAP